MLKEGERIFIEWPNGSYLNSLSSDFVNDFAKIIKLYGQPSLIEIRTEADWVRVGRDCEPT